MCEVKKTRRFGKIQIPEWVIWYALFLVIVIFWHLLMREYRGDAVNFFSKALDSNTLIEVLKKRYMTWTSRLLEESILFLLARNVLLWKICNIAVYAIFAYFLLRLTNFKHPKLAFGLWLTYPIIEMASAGWIATYMNYFWQLAAGMYSLISLQKIYCGERIRPLEWLSFSFATLFATNTEQVCVIFICILAAFGIEHYVIQGSKRDLLLFYILQWIITLGNVVFIMRCPGNAARLWSEIGSWMHDFGTMSIIDQGVLGVVVTMDKLVTGNLNFLIYVFLIFSLGVINQHFYGQGTHGAKNTVLEICYAAPCAFTIALTVLKNTSTTYFSRLQKLFSNIVKVDGANWNNFKYYIPFVIYMIMIMVITIALLNLFNNAKENLRLVVLFVTGLLSRVVMGFSPTLYASGMRTFLFFDALLIFSIVLMYDYSEEARNKLPEQVHKIASCLFSTMVALSVINNTIAICERM